MSDQPITEKQLPQSDSKSVSSLLAGIAILALAIILRDLLLPFLSSR